LSPPAFWANSDQIGTTYSGGIWLAATPVSRYSPEIQKLGELPSIASFFGDEAPSRLVTTEIRGHTAWEADLSRDFSCASGLPVSGGPAENGQRPGASPSPDNSLLASAVFYPSTESADVMWVEEGYVVEVSGPLPVDELAGLASRIAWQTNPASKSA
jgi:hypothetical protein